MNLLCCLLAEPETCCICTHTQRRKQTLESGLMHVLVYISKNQEYLKLLSNINVLLIECKFNDRKEQPRERESRKKATSAAQS